MAKAATNSPKILVMAFIDLSPNAFDMGVAKENRIRTTTNIMITEIIV
jgi:hypothetical protein